MNWGTCSGCTKWRVSCEGVVCDPDRTWNGKDGGCSFYSDLQEDRMLGRNYRPPVPTIGRQTSLEAFL